MFLIIYYVIHYGGPHRYRAVFEILDPKRIGVTTLTFRGHVIIGFPIGHFLLVFLWNNVSNSYGFRDIQWRICDAMVDIPLNDL